ncbi:alpha/beta-hydrolase [Punctularia strigosozonata HHB-11173 SS5]|uniref:alpha/beta-hydrolase n=1 Tax=Punctularia strigosozonata (strain HHB-11173) TaxID=741275 RepID=UPI0004416A95|nr:alpha/beta-hydrolase [Punctularia strigosozonata HHB-11173 SS5]EIN13102.1 alpha/beta-hydrolase [Punctularia strigosozonata HHB-11173 SS5]
MAFSFRRQPLRFFYLVVTILIILFIRLPYWLARYAIPAARPRPSWTLSRSLIVQFFRVYVNVLWDTEIPTWVPPDPKAQSADADGLVAVDAAPQYVKGEVGRMAEANGVSAVDVSGYWVGRRGADGKPGQKAEAGEKVVYHLHGGGFVMGAGKPTEGVMKDLYAGFQQYFPSTPRIFALEYRISAGPPFEPRNPFPAPLLDAVAGYNYLVNTLGFTSQNVVISGDSAGGALAVWFVRYLIAFEFKDLPFPGAVLLFSPTVDFANTHIGPNSSMARNARSDFVEPIVASGYTYRALTGNLSVHDREAMAWIAPASRSLEPERVSGLFRGFPKTCIVVGGAEQTYDPVVTLRNRIVAESGADAVHFIDKPDATHDFCSFAWHEPERTDALKDVDKADGSSSMLRYPPSRGLRRDKLGVSFLADG